MELIVVATVRVYGSDVYADPLCVYVNAFTKLRKSFKGHRFIITS